MKFSIDRSSAAEALKRCLACITSRTTLPILGCVRIDATAEGVRFMASDLDRWISCDVKAEVTKPGAVSIAAKLLAGILSRGDTATFAVDAKNKVTITCGGSTFKISGLAADEMPAIPAPPTTAPVVIPAAEWLDASRAVKWAASTDLNRYTLMGTHLHNDGDGKVVFVATDGRFLARTWAEADGELPTSPIIPTSAMAIIDMIAEGEGDITLRVGMDLITVVCNSATVTAKLIEGNYPNYAVVIPSWSDEKISRASLESKALLDTINQVSLVLRGNTISVRMMFGPEGIAFEASADGDSATANLAADTSGSAMEINLNPMSLSQPLRQWGNLPLQIEIFDGQSPCLIKSERHEFVLMPMRVA